MKEYIHDATSDIISQVKLPVITFVLLYHVYQLKLIQVAFSSDFCKQWNKDNLNLQQVPVNKKLHSIISHALKGIQKTLRTPFIFQVFNL